MVGAGLVSSRPAFWACLGAWLGSQTIFLSAMLRPRSSLFGRSVWKVPDRRDVALTFDDGPHPEDTPAILEILDQAGVKGTFFFVGERARRHPDLVRRAASAGHEVAAHSDSHPWWFSLAGPGRMGREVRAAADSLERLTGRRPRHFRPPMGHKNLFLDKEVREAGMEPATWSVRTYDTLGRSPESVRRSVLARAAPGDIILLHEGVRRSPGAPSPTVLALEGIIRGLRERGLEPVSLESLRSAPPSSARPPRPAAAASRSASSTG